MTTRSKAAVADEVSAIRELLSDLEDRLNRVGGVGKKEFSGATDDIYSFVDEALGRIVRRARDGAGSISDTVTDSATRLGTDTVKRIVDEVEHRPLVMLGVAAGIGFLFGLSRR
jgi:ElaB/YqjD/DUF883 family membrane-anchored ribosome-binding protein